MGKQRPGMEDDDDDDDFECVSSLRPPQRRLSSRTDDTRFPSEAIAVDARNNRVPEVDEEEEKEGAHNPIGVSACSSKMTTMNETRTTGTDNDNDVDYQLRIMQQIQQEQEQRELDLALKVSLQDVSTVDDGVDVTEIGGKKTEDNRIIHSTQQQQSRQSTDPEATQATATTTTTKTSDGIANVLSNQLIGGIASETTPDSQAFIIQQIQNEQEQRELEMALQLSQQKEECPSEEDDPDNHHHVATINIDDEDPATIQKQQHRLEVFEWMVVRNTDIQSIPELVFEWIPQYRLLLLPEGSEIHECNSAREKGASSSFESSDGDPFVVALEQLQKIVKDPGMYVANKFAVGNCYDELTQKKRIIELALRLEQEIRYNSSRKKIQSIPDLFKHQEMKGNVISSLCRRSAFTFGDDEEFRIRKLAIEMSFWNLIYADEETQHALNRTYKEIALALLMKDPLLLENIYCNEMHFSLVAVQQNGLALKHVPKELKNNKQIVLAAVRQSGFALRYGCEESKADIDIVTEAVNKDGCALKHTCETLRGDKRVVMTAVRQDGAALEYATKTMQEDKDIVMVALSHGKQGILKYASNDLRADKDVVLEAVTKDPGSIKFALGGLNQDRDCWVAAKMWDESQLKKKLEGSSVRIVLSTKFSLGEQCSPAVNQFTVLLNNHNYIADNRFAIYSPNAFNKATCDPEWTRMEWPCRGTFETCQMEPSLKQGMPRDGCCWRYSYRCHLEEAKRTKGFMVQVIETKYYQFSAFEKSSKYNLGNGQAIEAVMAQEVGVKVFRVYQRITQVGGLLLAEDFQDSDIEALVSSVRSWYGRNCDNAEISEIGKYAFKYGV